MILKFEQFNEAKKHGASDEGKIFTKSQLKKAVDAIDKSRKDKTIDEMVLDLNFFWIYQPGGVSPIFKDKKNKTNDKFYHIDDDGDGRVHAISNKKIKSLWIEYCSNEEFEKLKKEKTYKNRKMIYDNIL